MIERRQPMIIMTIRKFGRGSAIIAALLCLFCVGATAAANPTEPYVPASGNTVLEHLPSTSDPRVRQFDALRKQVEARPTDVKLGVALARAYLDYGRDTGDARPR